MNDPVEQYFLYPPNGTPKFTVAAPLSSDRGYFRVGPNLVCYGKTSAGYRYQTTDESLYDAADDVVFKGNSIELPFDPAEVITNLTYELYVEHHATHPSKLLRQAYYSLRPMLPIALRSPLQRRYFARRKKASFPAWPVDTTVDDLMNKLLLLGLKSAGVRALPFIWFWPDGASACSIMTHDVETEAGKEFCSELMDVDEEFGIPASFQIVPERRYDVTAYFINSLKKRDFEVNLQDLNHDGHLFSNYREFSKRVQRINNYGRDFDVSGFRSAILYRRQEWFGLLDFEYDMSVPNTAHYDPQPGGCCTVMPYFIGKILELPLTTSQDYTVFHYLKSYSLNLWRNQIGSILAKHGLISFIFHPDYLADRRALNVYRDLLAELGELRSTKAVWITHPREVNRWWRNRAAMRLAFRDGEWVIEGPDKDRARVAFASLVDGRIVYTIPEPSCSLVSGALKQEKGKAQ